MANASNPTQGVCPFPFLQEELFTNTTGFLAGRLCVKEAEGVHCCLPCPQTDWLYPDNFDTITDATSWINVAGMACTVFLLSSFAALPVEKTHRHYLSICLCIAIVLMQLGFIIPIAAKPEHCANAITPNDMQSSRTCALSGAFLLIGGWGGIIWIFLRALALHLQICWQVVMGKTFMFSAFATGAIIPAVGLALALVFSGVSFRFGDTCHINHTNSLADFWIPLLAFAGVTVIIQFATFGYCIKVYVASLSDDSTTTNSSGLPSYTTSVRTVSPRQAYRRVRRVIELQWRGIAIVLLILADVIFFAVIFVIMDNNDTTIANSPAIAGSWIICLITNHGDKNKCLDLASSLVVNEPTVMAVLVLLSLNGIWLLLLMGRFSMFTGWYELVKGLIHPNKEFVSADARTFAQHPSPFPSKGARSYVEITGGKENTTTRTPDILLTPLSAAARGTGPRPGERAVTPDYFGREAKYHNPTNSFSTPKPPQGQDWNSGAANARRVDPLSMNKI